MSVAAFATEGPPQNCKACVMINGFRDNQLMEIVNILSERGFQINLLRDVHISELHKCLREKQADNQISFVTRRSSALTAMSWFSTGMTSAGQTSYESSYVQEHRDMALIRLLSGRYPHCEDFRAGKVDFKGMFIFGSPK